MNLSTYVRQNQINLSADEIIQLFDDVENNKETIIKTQLALCLNLANRYASLYNQNVNELFSDALYAASKCISGFNPTLGLTFSTYAGKSIVNEFQLHQTNVIKQPKHQTFHQYPITKAYRFPEFYDYEKMVGDITPSEIDNSQQLVQLIKTIIPENKHQQKYQHIMIEYFGLSGDTKTFKQIGNDIGLTGERTRQHYHRLMQVLKKNKHLKRYLQDLNKC